jgi:hypothetical protein
MGRSEEFTWPEGLRLENEHPDMPNPYRRFGTLKNEWGMLPLRVRRIERVRVHVDLPILAQLVTALAKARAIPLAA